MKWMLHLGIAALVLAIAGAAYAYPTLTGPTGLLVLPTAYVANSGITVAGDYQKFDTGQGEPVRATIAFGNAWEFGAMYNFFSSGTGLDKGYGANAKLTLPKLLGGDIAVGAQFIHVVDTLDLKTDFEQAYFAWTGDLNFTGVTGLGLTLGVNYTRLVPDIGDSVHAWRGYAGLELNVIKDFTIIGEFQTRSRGIGDTDAISAFGVRYCTGQHWAIQAGYTNAFEMLGTPSHNFFGGVSLNFGGRSE